MKKIIFINALPVQYFAPLYMFLNVQGLSVVCWYCSDENVKGHTDREFNSQVKWDIPLLEGYQYLFFKNHSWKPSAYNGFFGLINWGMIKALFKEPKSIIVIHGWAYLTNILVIVMARLAGHTVCLRGESPLNQELLKSKKNRWIKQHLFFNLLFPFVNHFLYIGSQNKAFYLHYGVKEKQLIFVPYAVDNQRFQKAAASLSTDLLTLRSDLQLPDDSRILLFTAKFIQKKRPLDLLRAFEKMDQKKYALVMVGDGDLKAEMQNFIREKGLTNVYLPGFINQSEIVKYYAAADVFVMCSEEGETWGLSVNEAMNFNLPVVVSDMTGASFDLVKPGRNGFIFKAGDVDDLKEKLTSALNLKIKKENQDEILTTYSYATIARSLKELVNV